MFSGPGIRPIVIVGGALFAFIAGAVNMTGFLSAAHSAVSHMTGTATLLAKAARDQDPELGLRMGLILISFFAGAVISGAATGGVNLNFHRRYGVLIAVEGFVLLAAASLFHSARPLSAESCCAFACGIQNGMVTIVSGAIVRTTHLTGIVTDLGTHIGQILRGGPLHGSRFFLHFSILAGFATGAFATGIVYDDIGFDLLKWLAWALIAVGTGYFCIRQWVPRLLPGFTEPGHESS